MIVAQIRHQFVEATCQVRNLRVMEFIDRGADRHDYERGLRYALGVGGKREAAASENFFQERFAALFEKRQTPGCDCLKRRLINIQDQCLETAVGKYERERDSDVASAPDHTNVAIAGRRFRHRSMCPPATPIRIVARFKPLATAGSARIKFRSGLS